MRYEARGRLPAKRHVAFRENGTLLTEEVMGFEGCSGNESILYHLQTPCRVTGLGRFDGNFLELMNKLLTLLVNLGTLNEFLLIRRSRLRK